VVTCDLIMPEIDGVEFVRQQMARAPLPIVIVSVAAESGELVLSALEAGAVDFVQKPTALASDRLLEMGDDLVTKVKTAAVSHLRTAVAPIERRPAVTKGSAAYDIVVIGISTGGPQGLKSLVPRLPGDFPAPIAIVLHMPVGYTGLYARKLDEQSALHVLEAEEGMEVTPGTVYIAQAGRHLTFQRDGTLGLVHTHLDVRPLDLPYRPSVDVLFQSAAEIYGARTLGIVMTGMGSDGREGSAWIKARGGRILTESEATSVVYGMPRSVVEAGLSDLTVDLDGMADAILESV
jgi:two-component system chemotaxis response regulator CheB